MIPALLSVRGGILLHRGFTTPRPGPTEELRRLVGADEDGRRATLRRLAEEKYAEEIKLAEESGTYGQLLSVMRERGLSGATGRKAATFFTHLAEYVGLPISAYFTQSRAGSATAPATRRIRRKKPVEVPTVAEPVVHAAVSGPPAETLDTKRAKYIDLLMKLADREEGELPPAELLDRIERALGFQEKED